MVERVAVAPPQSRIGPLSEAERAERLRRSPLVGRYDKPVDRESAYEMLMRAAAKPAEPEKAPEQPGLGDKAGELLGDLASQALKSTVRQMSNQFARQLVRGLMGSLLGSKSRR